MGLAFFKGYWLKSVLTFILILTIYQTSSSKEVGNLSPIAIGFVLIAVIMMGMNISGASLNPARTIGPAVVSVWEFPWEQLWIFIVGPIVGGVLAALAHRVLTD